MIILFSTGLHDWKIKYLVYTDFPTEKRRKTFVIFSTVIKLKMKANQETKYKKKIFYIKKPGFVIRLKVRKYYGLYLLTISIPFSYNVPTPFGRTGCKHVSPSW